ncbi:hypothetical protein Hanom_Chr07g00591601 [Helianthus anomalus]
MELMSRMKIARFQTFWIHIRKYKPLDESRKSGQNLRDENNILLFFDVTIVGTHCGWTTENT